MGLIGSVFHGLTLAFDMAFDSWWALVLGFAITGAVEVFVSEDAMTDYLGGDGWREVGYGTAFGVASSSCSYSAIAMARKLFKKGASPVAALGAFMFAATDLVVELGLVMWVLLGWQFVAADFLGGLVAIAVLTLAYRRVPDEWWDVAYRNVLELEQHECEACGMAAPPEEEETVVAAHRDETLYFCCGGCLNAWEAMHDADAAVRDDESPSWLSRDGWVRAASASMREWDMLWDDIAVGFLLAGLIAGVVPRSAWAVVFTTNEGFLWVLWGALMATLVGVVTFICSVGNVPFALVLWANGVPFGAVLSFVFADLVIPPIVNAYRTYYGGRIAAVLFGAMAGAAVVAGVVVHYVFGLLGLIPPHGVTGGTAPGEYTVVLNLLFTAVFVAQLTAAYGRETVGNWLLDAIGRFGTWYYRVERVVGPVGELLLLLAAALRTAAGVVATGAAAAADLVGDAVTDAAVDAEPHAAGDDGGPAATTGAAPGDAKPEPGAGSDPEPEPDSDPNPDSDRSVDLDVRTAGADAESGDSAATDADTDSGDADADTGTGGATDGV
ncbi:permease [Halobaculum sp. D14]|uniref:permease n=1 Tax=Halobaculum sp. D14 TaxID=3421642 RepID=UPI003EBE8584